MKKKKSFFGGEKMKNDERERGPEKKEKRIETTIIF